MRSAQSFCFAPAASLKEEDGHGRVLAQSRCNNTSGSAYGKESTSSVGCFHTLDPMNQRTSPDDYEVERRVVDTCTDLLCLLAFAERETDFIHGLVWPPSPFRFNFRELERVRDDDCSSKCTEDDGSKKSGVPPRRGLGKRRCRRVHFPAPRGRAPSEVYPTRARKYFGRESSSS